MRGPWPWEAATLGCSPRLRRDLKRCSRVAWGEGSLQDSGAVVTIRSVVTDSRRDGGEKTAVTRARAAPCTPSSPKRSLPPSPAAAGLAVQ
ncbi:hypothetical protein MJG53_012098 [Ovis ammon polii x Ovis aries]|uniref:Uncharacterized protein n=3 Tax=Ovis TaxID=9935 RepID=A0A836A346_SHEEP|nr:hypothetical protein JEQ12_004731 [Ovis aries]KAI4538592.1 hypothetical protein MG293_011995 [Ovis ammon polii]KAI4575895.1 hypothetical protein MJG53_012098 [Ovis ammon polii x Ovis aries]